MPNLKCNSFRELTVHGVNRQRNYTCIIISIELCHPEDGGSSPLRTVETKPIKRLGFLTAMFLKIRVFWHVTPCRWALHYATLTLHWKPEKNIVTWFGWFWGWLFVLPDNILGQKVAPWSPAVYTLHIQEAIKYADSSVNWVWRNICTRGGAVCVGHWIFWCHQGWPVARASRASL
jgi:hypothetical protein